LICRERFRARTRSGCSQQRCTQHNRDASGATWSFGCHFKPQLRLLKVQT
jgi:hypothetical protein